MSDFNEGQPVYYYPALGINKYTVEITASDPFDFNGDEVIKLKGKAGFFATENLKAVNDDPLNA